MEKTKLKINGMEIRKGYCSVISPCYIRSKIFDMNVVELFPDEDNKRAVGLTEDKILYLFNKAESFEITKEGLNIVTDEYTY